MFTTTPFEPNTEGVWLNLPSETYHAAPGLSHSMTKHLNPPGLLPVYLSEKHEPTAAMMMGTLVHQRPKRPRGQNAARLPQLLFKVVGV